MSATILIVENDDDLRASLGHLLRGRGFRVVDVSTGSAGVAAAISQKPDLILLDLILADIDGPAVAAKLRAVSSLRETPLIAVSGAADDEFKDSLQDFDDVLQKPFRIAGLLAIIDRYLGIEPSTVEGKGAG